MSEIKLEYGNQSAWINERGDVEIRGDEGGWALILPHERQRMAALCLEGQPFGFTWEGHDAIRGMLDHAERFLAGRMSDHIEWARLKVARTEVEKIAALLHPRST